MMDADMKKVIKGLEYCSVQAVDRDCDNCPIGFGEGCALKLKRDALKLLKVQEPIEPEFKEHIEPDLSYWTCGACGAFLWGNAMGSDVIKIIYKPNYCQHCGQAVKWDA